MKILIIAIFILQQIVCIQIFSQTILTKNESDDRYPNWSPDGESIVFESNRNGNWEIYLMNKNGSDIKQITFNEYDERRPSWHPDGETILFESNRDGPFELYTINVANSILHKITIQNHNHDIAFSKYSPNGDKIAFSSVDLEREIVNINIYIVDSSGQNLKQLTFDSTRSVYPDWSSDGKQIYFFSRRDTNNKVDEIYSIDLTTNQTFRITNWPTSNFAPSVSSNDDYIVCSTSFENSRPELFLIYLTSKELKRITFNDFGDNEPAWHPQENIIAYACQKNGNYDICLMEIEDMDSIMQKD